MQTIRRTAGPWRRGMPSAELRTRRWLAWSAPVAVVLGQVVADIALHSHVSPLYQDGADYHRLAARLALHGAYGPPVAFRPPGWVFVLAAAYRVFGAHPVVGLALNAAFAAAVSLLVQRLGRRLGLSPLASLAAALGAGLFPWMLLLGSTLYSETFYLLILVALALALITALDAGDTRTRTWLLIGGVAGYGALVRPALLFWLPIGAWLVLRRSPRPGVRTTLALALGVVIVLAPWTVRNYARLHTLVPIDTAGGSTLAVANNDLANGAQSSLALPPPPPGSEVKGDQAYRAEALRWIQQHPKRFLVLIGKRLVRSLDPMALLNKGIRGPAPFRWLARAAWALVGLLAAIGAVKYHRGAWAVLLSLLVPQLIEIALFGGGFRFFAPSVAFLFLLAVAGAVGVLTVLVDMPVAEGLGGRPGLGAQRRRWNLLGR